MVTIHRKVISDIDLTEIINGEEVIAPSPFRNIRIFFWNLPARCVILLNQEIWGRCLYHHLM